MPPALTLIPLRMLDRVAADGLAVAALPLPIADAAALRVVGAPANSERVPSWPRLCARKRPSSSAISSSSARSCRAVTATSLAVGSGFFGLFIVGASLSVCRVGMA